MNLVTNHRAVIKQWQELKSPDDRKELDRRVRGYILEEVARHWGVLHGPALQLQILFLRVDLLYPLLYGVAFAIAAAQVWTRLGQPSWAVWSIIPIALIMVADWAENLLHLNQFRSFMENGAAGLQTEKIRIASIATMIKLRVFWGTAILLLALAFFAACVMP